MMKDVDRSCPCYGCNKRHAEHGYNCHSDCPEYKKWADKIASENELVRRKKAEEADDIGVRITSIKRNKREKETEKCRWKG